MLRDLAKHFVGRDLSNYCFVFPNRRAGIFFREYLKDATTETMITPEIKTIEEMFQELSTYKKADKLELIFNLYAAYTTVLKNNGRNAESFEDFIPFGQTLIADFNDIDNYKVDVDKLLQNIDELQQMDASDEYLNDDQVKILKHLFNYSDRKHVRKFKSIWNLLRPIYYEFKKRLDSKGLAYDGMLSRSVIENSGDTIDTPYDRVVFVGFNALDEVEKALFKALGAKADFYWDYDLKPYSDDADNLANFFMADNQLRFSSKEHIERTPMPSQTHFHNIVASSMTAQTYEAQKILKQINNGSTDTAVVLLDENLLLPMLFALPIKNEDECNINVTMGFPISHTTVVEFIEDYILLQNGASGHAEETNFYYKHVLTILSHPYIQHLMPVECANLTDEITKNNKIRVEISLINEYLQGNNVVLGVFKTGFDNILDQVINVLKSFETLDNDYERECKDKALLTLGEMKMLMAEFTEVGTPKALRLLQIIKQAISNITISFKGEPVSGLQIMGTLETRCLDFKNILFLSFNEGVFPKTGRLNSIIPYNIRKGYGLPTTEHQDAVYAYNFYRLAAHAENVYLISDCRTDNMRSGEPSRYLNQLRYIYSADIEDIVAKDNIKIERESDEIAKPAEFTERLLSGRMRVSPSSLNTYMMCPFQYYLQEFLKIREDNEVTEIMEENDFGSIFHKAMEILYTDLNAELHCTVFTADALTELKKSHKLERAVRRAFNEEYFNNKTGREIEISGVNLLNMQVILRYIKATIDEDIRIAPFTLIKCEHTCEAEYFFNKDSAFANKAIQLKGKIDRIDSYIDPATGQKCLRLIDYKTGAVKVKSSKLDSDDNAASRQLLLYRYMIENDRNFKAQCDCYDLKVYGVGSMSYSDDSGTTTVDIKKYDEFLTLLSDTLTEMVNPDIPIKKKHSKCDMCKLKDICRRL